MKVKSSLIHPEMRVIGSLVRPFLRFRSKQAFIRANNLQNRFIAHRFPKDMNIEERYIHRRDGGLLRILICYPNVKADQATGVLWLHGGGYAIGLPELELNYAKIMMNAANAVIVMPDYRLSTQAPYPAALDDSYDTLMWMKEKAGEIGINRNQLFVAGESAGGGLTAAVTAFARDRGEVNIAFQMPLYPMLDDRMMTPSSIDNDAPVWDSQSNEIAWKLYLGDLFGTNDVPPYAAPARLTDYSNLPPTYTFVGDIEPFYDETVKYVAEVKKAGGIADIDIYPGCFHAFDLFGVGTQVGKAATDGWINRFQFACANYFAPQK